MCALLSKKGWKLLHFTVATILKRRRSFFWAGRCSLPSKCWRIHNASYTHLNYLCAAEKLGNIETFLRHNWFCCRAQSAAELGRPRRSIVLEDVYKMWRRESVWTCRQKHLPSLWKWLRMHKTQFYRSWDTILSQLWWTLPRSVLASRISMFLSWQAYLNNT